MWKPLMYQETKDADNDIKGDDDIPGVVHHLLVGSVRDGEEMRGDLIPPFADVEGDHSVGVERIALVRVDDHAEQTRVSLDRWK